MNDIHTPMSSGELAGMNVLSLAHVGDAVYELLVRDRLARSGALRVNDQHKQTISYVSAPAQAAFIQTLLPELTEAEQAIYRRGRNTRVHGCPSGCSIAQYHAATGLEVLFGWLWLAGQIGRIQQLFARIAEVHDGT